MCCFSISPNEDDGEQVYKCNRICFPYLSKSFTHRVMNWYSGHLKQYFKVGT